MKTYYYAIGKQQFGPFSLDELKEKNLLRDALVWHDKMKDWIEAERIEELAGLFKSASPTAKKK